ncbi:MAG: hypothetical protein CL678_05135 [Bdellovibrionaceae bacterium]|nr:hypothetical protein [Pseudobdellovibrionaceae bacterium]
MRLFLILFSLLLCPLSWSKDCLVFNGGGDDDENFIYFEIEAKFIFEKLCKKDGLLFSQKGKKSKVVRQDSSKKRDEQQWSRPVESTSFKTEPVKPATQKSLISAIQQLKKDPSHSVFIFINNHGGRKSLTTSDGEVDYQIIRDKMNQLASKKNVRAIFHHCFAGAQIVDPERNVPLQAEEYASQYLDFHYPSKKCALATTRHSEVAFNEDSFEKTIRLNSKVSLYDLSQQLNSQFDSQVMLTSDYFIEDFWSFLCRSPQNVVFGSCSLPSAFGEEFELQMKDFQSLIQQSCHLDEIKKLKAAEKKLNDLYEYIDGFSEELYFLLINFESAAFQSASENEEQNLKRLSDEILFFKQQEQTPEVQQKIKMLEQKKMEATNESYQKMDDLPLTIDKNMRNLFYTDLIREATQGLSKDQKKEVELKLDFILTEVCLYLRSEGMRQQGCDSEELKKNSIRLKDISLFKNNFKSKLSSAHKNLVSEILKKRREFTSDFFEHLASQEKSTAESEPLFKVKRRFDELVECENTPIDQ